MKTYAIKTFGCQMNYADSEKINMALLSAGLLRTLDVGKADIVVLNTCSVRQKWEDKVFSFVSQTRKLAIQEGRSVYIGITGCMVRKTGISSKFLDREMERHPNRGAIELLSDANGIINKDDELLWRSNDIDFVFRIEEVGYLTKILSMISGEDIGNDEKWEEYLKMRGKRENPSSANIIIQTGCDNFCSFCIVPHTRGRETSRPLSEIVEEVRGAVVDGATEITLLGQNVNSYGKETRKKLWNPAELTWNRDTSGAVEGGKTPFRELLDAVGEIHGLDRIRFTSSNPHDMTRDILDAHFEIPAMCHYLHFALQSGSDSVLKHMNRKHSYADFKAQVEYLRSRDPLFSISTDIIVGFPGETEEEFEATCQAFREIDFDQAYIARYSSRRGTYATDVLGDDIDSATKARRWNTLTALLGESIIRRNTLMLGRVESILVTDAGRDGEFVGRTRNFKEVFFNVHEGIAVQPGDLVDVKITGLKRWVLVGGIV